MKEDNTDSQLVKLLLQPSTRRKAFEKLVKAYSARLYWQIRHMVLTHDDTNDVLQNTFLKAWSNLDSFRAEAKLSTWLYRIAINESLTFLQKKKDMTDLESASGAISLLVSDPYFDGEETDLQLQEAVASLPERQRLVFNMKYFQEMKYEEISEILNTSTGALKASYHFAVEKIKKYFDEHD